MLSFNWMSKQLWPVTTVLGVRIHTLSYPQVNAIISERLSDSNDASPLVIVTPNPELLVYASRHSAYHRLLNQADLALPDGVGLILATGGRIRQRVTGVDILPTILSEAEKLGLTVGIVHRSDGLATVEQMTADLHRRYPNLPLQFTRTDFTTAPDVIIVTLGHPEQEQWFQSRRERYHSTRLVLAAGGAVDFLIGAQVRAPGWFRLVGVEWLWRLVRQPRRWRRIVTAVIIFPGLLLRQLIVKQSIS